MALLSVQPIPVTALNPVFVPADVGLTDTFANTGKELVIVKNGGGSPITVTATVTGTISTGQTIDDEVVTIPAGEERFFPPLSVSLYSSLASLVYSDVTSVTVGVFLSPVALSATIVGA